MRAREADLIVAKRLGELLDQLRETPSSDARFGGWVDEYHALAEEFPAAAQLALEGAAARLAEKTSEASAAEWNAAVTDAVDESWKAASEQRGLGGGTSPS